MDKIFYAERKNSVSTEEAIRKIFSEYYDLKNIEIKRSETGKPFLKNAPLFFSVTHTGTFLFVAVSDRNIGIDAEPLDRALDYPPVLSRFPLSERKEIRNKTDFFKHWTAKESTIKWLGGTLATDLKKLCYLSGQMFFRETKLPVRISHFEKENHIVALCRDTESADPPFVRILL